MQRSPFLVLLLVLSAAGCAAPPSSVPLGGGKEWRAAEKHEDRRDPASELPTKPQLVAAPAVSVSARPSASASAAALVPSPAPAGEVALGLASFKQGDTITLRSRFTLRAVLTTKDVAKPQNLRADATKHLSVRIVEAGADGVRAATIDYLAAKSHFRLGGTAADSAANRGGRRYRVSFVGGTPRVSIVAGAAGSDDAQEVLFDLATVTGYVPLAKRHLPLTLPIDWSARLSAEALRSACGVVSGLRFDDAQLTLRGRDPTQPELALFDCSLPVHVAHQGVAFSVDLSGSCALRAAEGRPVRLRLQGPVRSAQDALGAGTASISGTLEVELDQSYGP
ncbi:MAG TPA: hypothetical protein VER33_02285 [Polyangiaceae bacterium]|nr:hypothetical protein [Polyangiaceae bacterium]